MKASEQDEILYTHLLKNKVETKTVLDHPVGLFVLFFTEMWERFSYYGMRALLVLFLVSEITKDGWAWTNAEAMSLFGTYTSLVYLTPLLGGLIADKIVGYRKAVLWGALIMTLGHASMALEGITSNFFYIGLGLLILGNGLFKPNISSMVGQLYPDNSDKKDSAFTIFYMGINAGAFLGIMLCGYIGEKIGWHLGFGLAGIFMFFGMLQFYFGQKIFGQLGESPKEEKNRKALESNTHLAESELQEEKLPANIVRDRLIVILVLTFFSIFFWLAFEQAGGSMTIFAKDYTQRILVGNSAIVFKWIDAALTVLPLALVTWVLVMLAKQISKKYPATIFFTALSFIIIWIIAIWKVYKEFAAVETEVTASWFQILNSFFIITFATVFAKIWETKFNPSGPVKFALGLGLLGIGFGALAYGSKDIPQGQLTAQVSMIWLVLAYFFHTMGELCLSPVGLSYVSKLSPKHLVGLIFGVWFLSSAVALKLGGVIGGFIDTISQQYSISAFFLIFFATSLIAGLILFLISPWLKKMMHGIH
ncbi:MAG TPA: peptide MFS transporter [Sphingobacteriaceae bacterium]|nr:peptide MFS transporter [Sphingobacteriaceae bacterium]